MASLATFGRQIEISLRGIAKPAERRAEIVRVAGEVLREAQDTNRRELGTVPEHVTFVDGQKVTALGGINPDHGTIAFRFEIDFLGELVAQTHRMLVQHSSVLSGAYRDAHRIIADGRDVTDSMPLAPAVSAKVEEWVLFNPLPYSRKIEQGGMKMRVPGTEAVYESAAAIMNLRAGRAGHRASIRFTYRSPDSAYVRGGANRAERAAIREQPGRIKAMRAERQSRVPAIIIQRA